MSPLLILICFLFYTALLFYITWLTSRGSDNESYFIGNKSSPWYVVAYGMIGASLSGVTFMSLPGWVGSTQFSYMIMVFGYLIGYIVIALVLMPLYYRLNLISIYAYLEQRFGFWSYKTGAFFFLLSRVIGASFRIFLVVNVLHIFVFDAWELPFWVTACIFILLIILYTFKAGVKTIIWTDTLQTTFMLLSLVISIVFITRELNINFYDIIKNISDSGNTQMFFTEWNDKRNFLKQFIGGVFIAIVMTGLDQEMMQKNLSCRNIKDAQKNMFTFSFVLVFINLLFLVLGAILYFYASVKGIDVPKTTDDLFPMIALKYLSPVAGIVFLVGLISAAYPSADGALTALTTSFCLDFLGLKKNQHEEKRITKTRYCVHLCFALLLLLVIIIFHTINNQAVINKLFTIAGYTYGPLLGLFAFGLFTKLSVKDKWVPLVCLLSPIICFFMSEFSELLFNGYKFSFELLLINGLFTFLGLTILQKKQ